MRTERTVRNCKDRFKFVCPKRWEELQSTGDETVRHCGACNEDVFLWKVRCTVCGRAIGRAT